MGHSLNFGRDVIYVASRIMARNVHSDKYKWPSSCCGKHAVPVTYIHWDMHLFLRLSGAYWIHAYHIGSKLISLDTCISCWIQAVQIDCICRVLQVERMDLCALGGGGGGDRGGPAYNGCTIACVQVALYLYYCARNTNRM